MTIYLVHALSEGMRYFFFARSRERAELLIGIDADSLGASLEVVPIDPLHREPDMFRFRDPETNQEVYYEIIELDDEEPL